MIMIVLLVSPTSLEQLPRFMLYTCPQYVSTLNNVRLVDPGSDSGHAWIGVLQVLISNEVQCDLAWAVAQAAPLQPIPVSPQQQQQVSLGLPLAISLSVYI